MERVKEKSEMKYLRSILIVAAMLAFLFLSSGAFAGTVKVIANPSVSVNTVSPEDLQSVFLLDIDSLGGSRVEPVLAKAGAAHEAFLKTYLGKDDPALHAFYRGLMFSGKASMPKFLETDADVVAYVARTRGAVGYVGNGVSTPGVKVLSVK